MLNNALQFTESEPAPGGLKRLKLRLGPVWSAANRRACRLLARLKKRRQAAGGGLQVLEEHYGEVEQAGRELEGTVSRLEAQFLATSSELMELSRLTQNFVQEIEKLVGMATGQTADDAVFKSAIKLIEQPMEFLVACHEQTDRTLDNLRGHNQSIQRLLQTEADLQHTMAPLRFVQILFKVESAPLGAEVQQMFGSLTQEIEKFHIQVRDIFGRQFKNLEQTHGAINGVIARLEPQAQSLRQITTTQKAQIDESLLRLQQELSTNHERDARLSQLGREIAADVEKVVLGVQFQDIINQKLQHVRAALPQIRESLEQLQRAPRGGAAKEPLAFLHQSCRLQAEQIKSVREDLAQAQAQIQDGIQKVRDHVKRLDNACLSLDEFNLLTTSFDGMVQVLVETIEKVREMVTHTAASSSEVYELLLPMGSLASNLTGVVRGLSCRIHLIGLNAQIQAAHVGRGVGLEVLSARTSEISQETNRISQQAATQLDELARGLADNVKAFEQLRSRGQAHREVLNQPERTEEAQLHRFRDDALNALRAIGDLLESLERQARQALDTVHYQEASDGAMGQLQAAFEKLAESVARHDEFDEAKSYERLEALKREYTMASEVQTFERALKGAAPAPAPASASASAGTSPGGSVDLFADSELVSAPAPRPSQAASPPAAAEAAAEAPGGDSGPAPAAAAPAPAPNLGGNVELF